MRFMRQEVLVDTMKGNEVDETGAVSVDYER
jgi:hypothetical protein